MDSYQLTTQMIARRATTAFGDREVVSVHAGTVTRTSYADLFRRVDRLAHALRGLGIGPGGRVATLVFNESGNMEIYMAVTMSGAVLHTVNLRLPAEQVAYTIEHARDELVIFDGDQDEVIAGIRSDLDPGCALVRLDEPGDSHQVTDALDYELLLAEAPATPFDFPELAETSTAAVSYSSATTGTPKGVAYSHRALVLHSMMLGLHDTWALGEADTVLPIVPMFHVNAWGIPFAALWMGSRLVLPGRRPTGAGLAELMRAEDVTFVAAVPTVWSDVFARADGTNAFPSLRMAVCGGAPLSSSLLAEAERLGVPMVHSYGMTEATPLVLVNGSRSTDPVELDRSTRLRQGFVVPGVEFTVRDESGATVAWDGLSQGELCLRGPWIAESYERDERTAASFVDGWYHTGDVVTVDPAGRLKVVDRMADLIKSGGEWISTLDLQDALDDHPEVVRSAIVGVPNERWQERPFAFIASTGDLDPDALRAHLEQRFPRFWLPDEFVQLDQIPLNPVGKIDKRSLRVAALEHLAGPGTP